MPKLLAQGAEAAMNYWSKEQNKELDPRAGAKTRSKKLKKRT